MIMELQAEHWWFSANYVFTEIHSKIRYTIERFRSRKHFCKPIGILSLFYQFGAELIKPENPERFDHIHVDVPEETPTQVDDFQKKLMETIPLIAVKIF